MSLLGGGTQSKPTPPSVAMRVQTSVAGKCIPIVYGQIRMTGNLIWYGNFKSWQVSSGGGKSGGKGGGGGGKGGKGGSGSYNYSATVLIGVCEGPVAGVLQAWNGSTAESLAGLNLNCFVGGYSQSTWSAMSSLAPSEALPYRGLCYLGASPFALGGSPVLPNLNYEVLSGINGTGSSFGPDADASVVIADYLTNPNYGVGFPSAFLGSFATYQAMTLAAGLVISDGLTNQTAANTYLGDLLTATNSEFVWSSGLLTIIPYGDAGTISGNGYNYTPPTTPLFNLTDDDFMKNQGGSSIGVSSYTSGDPIIITRKRRSDALNNIKVEYLDRNSTFTDPTTGAVTSNAYNPTIAEVMDDAAIITWGLRPSSTKTMHFFCNASAAIMAANLQLAREQVLAYYTFTLDQRYIVLDPMDLVEITDSACGLVNQAVLIKEITENADGSLTVFAEQYLGITTAAPAHGLQAVSGYVQTYNVGPPSTNTPILFAAPPEIATNGGLEIWMVASGASGWGGCDVWISGDGSTYMNVGRMVGPCRQGVLTAPFAAGADPDTVNTLAVDLTESAAQLLSGTHADADNANTLCYCDGELIAYSTANLTAQYKYSLTGYTRRGMYGTSVSSHATGTQFARLDSEVFHYPYSVDQIGNTIYVKLTAFNIYGGGEEELSEVEAVSFVIPAPPPPSNVTGFTVSEQNNIVVFGWNAVPDFALKGYDIGYAPEGTTDWSLFSMLTEAGAGTEMTNADVPPGTWVFGIRARDIANQLSSQITMVSAIITAQDVVIANVEQSTAWLGTLSGFVRHYSGVLVPDDQNTIAHYAAIGFSAFSGGLQPTPVTTATYTAPLIDQGYTANNRVYANVGTGLNGGQSGSPTLSLGIESWVDGASNPGSFTSWTSGYETLRYLIMQITMSGISAGSVSYLKEFAPIIDTGNPGTTYNQAATIAAGGTTVTFSRPFNIIPAVVPSVVGTSAVYASVGNITKTTCMVNVWNSSGVSVGGAVNLQCTGE